MGAENRDAEDGGEFVVVVPSEPSDGATVVATARDASRNADDVDVPANGNGSSRAPALDEFADLLPFEDPTPPFGAHEPTGDRGRGSSSERDTDDSLPALRRSAHFVDGVPEPLAESLRYAIAKQRLADEEDIPRRIGVVSAVPGEGVTTVSRALAIVLSRELGEPACWVDLNWATAGDGAPRQAGRPGISEVLSGDRELDDVLQWDDGAAILNRGSFPRWRRPRIATSPQFAGLLDQLDDRFAHTLLDLPAVLAGSDALSMLRHVDAHLLVVRHGVTTMSHVRAAAEQIAAVPSFGVVLNDVRTRTPRPIGRWLAR